MKIVHLTANASRRAAGVWLAVEQLTRALHRGRVAVSVIASRDDCTGQDLVAWDRNVPLDLVTLRYSERLGYAPELPARLAAANPDLLHSHGSWMFHSLASLRWRRRHERPGMISPHGMIDPWALATSPWKKRLVGWLFEHRHLQTAACLHALSKAEATAFRSFGLRNPICVLPNGIDLPPAGRPQQPAWAVAAPAGRKRLLFMGRLHPKKGLPALLEGWARLRPQERAAWCLVIAGWDQGGHRALLERQAAELGLTAEICFVGPQFDTEKAASFAAADAFVLPSLSEGLPMAVLEAWSFGLPVLMTPQCNLEMGFTAGAALRIEPQAAALAEGLRQLFALSESQRAAMGAAGLALVRERLTWPKIAAEMRAVYQWILGGGAPPACVMTE